MARKTATPPTNPPTDPNPDGVPWDEAPPASSTTDLDIFGGDGGALATFDAASISAGLANLAGSISAAGGIGGGMSFLGLGRDGVWAYGADKTECEDGVEWALDTRTLKHGQAAWADGKLLREVMVPISAPAPDPTTLPIVAAPYQAAFSVEMRCMGGQDKGTKVLYKTNSVGGRSAFAKLVEALINRLRTGSAAIFPAVLLKTSSYNHSTYGKIYTPVLHVTRWFDVTGKSDGATPAPSVAASAQAQTRPQPEPAPAAPPGVRRRRVEA